MQAGLRAIYCSGWQVAGDGNSAGEMYPDQSLYPVDSVPKMVERISNAFIRTDEIHALNEDDSIDWFAPIVADAEAGFGGNLNAFELMKHMIRAGAAGVHFEGSLAIAYRACLWSRLANRILLRISDTAVATADDVIISGQRHGAGIVWVVHQKKLFAAECKRCVLTVVVDEIIRFGCQAR